MLQLDKILQSSWLMPNVFGLASVLHKEGLNMKLVNFGPMPEIQGEGSSKKFSSRLG